MENNIFVYLPLNKLINFILCVCVFCLTTYLYATWKPEQGISFPGYGILDDFEPSSGLWESNLCHLEEKLVL